MPLFKKARPATGDDKPPAPAYEPSELAKTIAAHMQRHPEQWEGTNMSEIRCGTMTIRGRIEYGSLKTTFIYNNGTIIESGGRALFSFLCEAFDPVREYQLRKSQKDVEKATEHAIEMLSIP